MDENYKVLLRYLGKKAPGTVAIFLRKDSRELFDEDARLVADELLMSDVGISTVPVDDRLLTVLNLNKSQYSRVIRDLLLIQRCRVEVFEEAEGGESFEVIAKGDLTNYEDFKEIVESCVELGELSTVMSVRIHGKDSDSERLVSVVLCNPHDMRLTIAEFSDTPNFYFLGECIQNTVPRECLVFASDNDKRPEAYKALLVCLNRSNVPWNVAKEREIEETEARERFLSLLFKDSIASQSPSLSKNVVYTADPLIGYMNLLPDSANKFLLASYKSAGYLHLDAAAVRALELFSLVQDDDDEPARGVGTLYDHLNKCRSDPGRKLLRTWMRRPLSDLRRINERLDVVDMFVEDHQNRTLLSDKLLRQVPDTTTIERRMLQQKTSLHDCYRLFRLFHHLVAIQSTLESMCESCCDQARVPSMRALLLDPVADCIKDFAAFSQIVNDYVDLDYADDKKEYRIKPEVDDDLLDCFNRLSKLEKEGNKLLQKIVDRSGLERIKLEVPANGSCFFRAPMRDEKTLNKMAVSILSINKGSGVSFTTKELDAISADYSAAKTQYEEMQEKLINEVKQVADQHTLKLQKLNEVLGLIDILVAFSVVSSNSMAGYVRPQLLERGSGVLELVQARHPVIEDKADAQFISNDVSLSYENVDGKITGPRFAVVTGANMGGKSTYLRTTGLCVIMAQMGCFVPADSARFSVLDGIHTRVGASDYQCEGVSTFMAEMVDCVTIVDAAKPTSLVLMDELGRGTSTYDGFGMAWGMANYILNTIGCFCLFATHYHEMSLLKERFPNDVRNLCVETHVADDGSIALLYKIVEGLADKSFGINIAKAVQFPEHVIKESENILHFLETGSWDSTGGFSKEKIDEARICEIVAKVKALHAEIQEPEELKRRLLEVLPESL